MKRIIKVKKETKELVPLASKLARLTSLRSCTPRAEGLGDAYRQLMEYADKHGLPQEEFCDKAMLVFFETRHDVLAA